MHLGFSFQSYHAPQKGENVIQGRVAVRAEHVVTHVTAVTATKEALPGRTLSSEKRKGQ